MKPLSLGGVAPAAEPRLSPLRSSADCSAASLYRFGLSVGMRTLPGAPREALKNLVLPVEYIRCAESLYVLRNLEVNAGHRVLDIGSPKLPSLFLAARIGALVHATDLLDYFFVRYGTYADAVLGPRRALYRMEAQDARRLTYPDATFDRVFSISAIEHIPDDGDRQAMEEIARVLRPGGLVCLTVPWGLTGYVEEFRRAGDPDTYWARSNGAPIFYQRAYDRRRLEERLIGNPAFELVDLSFWGERRIPVEHLILSRKLPRWLRWAMLPAHFPLSRLFLSPLGEAEPCRKKVACITLRRLDRD
jgi:SAM-dependent methyltransferase